MYVYKDLIEHINPSKNDFEKDTEYQWQGFRDWDPSYFTWLRDYFDTDLDKKNAEFILKNII